ncbi:MAG TPA: hypothetical protein VHV55_23020 [Pirellulales bacterium]|jgi:hypothetical protein|nr:hypothetical protein [Pirellulales bacterium]
MRMLVALLALLILVCAGACAYLVLCALDPTPGANLALMGLPVLALPMGTAWLVIAGIVVYSPSRFSTRERTALLASSILFLLPLIALVALG